MLNEAQTNRSPAGLLDQVSLSASPAAYLEILEATTALHVTRIHIFNDSADSVGDMYISHVPLGGTATKLNTIFRPDPPAQDLWIWEAPSLGATISLGKGDTLQIDTDANVGISLYGYGSER